MRHNRSRLRLNQKPDHSRGLERNLVTSVLLYESVRTTQKRARVIAPIIDGLITIAKTKTPHVAIRAINQVVTDRNASRKLMEVLRTRYASRTGGYTTVKAVGSRKGDGAAVVDFSLIDAVIASPTPVVKVAAKKSTTKTKTSERTTKTTMTTKKEVVEKESIPSSSSL